MMVSMLAFFKIIRTILWRLSMIGLNEFLIVGLLIKDLTMLFWFSSLKSLVLRSSLSFDLLAFASFYRSW